LVLIKHWVKFIGSKKLHADVVKIKTLSANDRGK